MAKNLFESMIHSAANQFARDGGKALSNSVYGDAHSTPIRRVGRQTADDGVSQPIYEGDKVEVTAEEVRQYYTENGMSLKVSRTSVGQVIGVAILGVIPFFISALAFAFASIRRIWYFFSDDAIYAKKALVARKVPDRRCRCGYRIEGYQKGYETIAIPPTLRERSVHLLVAFLYAIIAAGLFYWSYYVISLANEETSTTSTEQVSVDNQ